MSQSKNKIFDIGFNAYEKGDYKTAVEYYEKYIMLNLKKKEKSYNAVVTTQLINCYLKGLGTRRNINKVIFLLDYMSWADSDCCYLLGMMYTLGLYKKANYKVGFDYLNKAFLRQQENHWTSKGIQYSIAIGDAYQHGIGVKQDKKFALYNYADGLYAYGCTLASRIADMYLGCDDASIQLNNDLYAANEDIDLFRRYIRQLLENKDYIVDGKKKEVSDIAKLSIKEVKEHQGNQEANIKLIYSILLSKDYKKQKAYLYYLLNSSYAKQNLHAGFLLAELSYREKLKDKFLDQSYDVFKLFKVFITNSMVENLQDEINNPLFIKAMDYLELGFEEYCNAIRGVMEYIGE